MITKNEIDERAREFEIKPSNVQRDYVFGWLLHGLFVESNLKDALFVKGGNAMRKGYFPETRFSGDLDLGVPGDIEERALLMEVNRICDLIGDRAGIAFVSRDNRIEEKFPASESAPLPDLRVFEVRVYFKDFYGNADHLRLKVVMDVTRFDRVLLPIQSLPLIHPYSDASNLACQIRCMKLEEIIATKLKCLIQREHAPDLFDYVYAIQRLGREVDRGEVVRAFLEKTIFRRNPQVAKRILKQTPWEFWRACWDGAVVCAKAAMIRVDEAIDFFLADLESLFGDYPDTGYEDFLFFGPELRVPIMRAARTQTLLKMRYKGEDRIIEPYSLKFLERRDRVQREYFFGFNRSGGSNPPGMRTFVANRVEEIENTNEVFKPQFPIELSKAGETPENPYLFDPNKPMRAPRTHGSLLGYRSIRPTRSPFEPRYVYQCTYCGRQFTRRQQGATLREHKDKNGHWCPGRHGFYVTMKY